MSFYFKTPLWIFGLPLDDVRFECLCYFVMSLGILGLGRFKVFFFQNVSLDARLFLIFEELCPYLFRTPHEILTFY